MKKNEKFITLEDKLELIANLTFYEGYFDGSYEKKQKIWYALSGIVGVGCFVGAVLFSPMLAVPSLCFWGMPTAFMIGHHKDKKNIIKQCGFGFFSYKDFKQLKKSGEYDYLKANYAEEIKQRTRFGILNGNMEIYRKSKPVSETELEAEFSRVFGTPAHTKTEQQIKTEEDCAKSIDKIFKPNRPTKIYGYKKEDDLEK